MKFPNLRFKFQLNPRISVCIVFISAMFMSFMDGTIVNVALPVLGRQFQVSSTAIEGVVIAYLLSIAVVIPVSGWLGDRWGTRRIFLWALALFTITSVLCGLAANLPMLIGFRALQGIAGGILAPVGMAMILRTFPLEQRVQVSRLLIIPTIIAPAIGPILGGLLVDQLSWRWVFFVNIPIGIAAWVFGMLFLQDQREATAGRFDIAGFLLAGSGLSCVMYALHRAPLHGWNTSEVLGSGIAGIFLLCVFVIVELRQSNPMLDLRLLGNRLFRTMNMVSFCTNAGYLGTLVIVPLFLQEARDESALTSGLTIFPEALGVILASQLVARIYPRVGPRRIMFCGLVVMACMLALLGLIGQNTDLWFMRIILFIAGGCMACMFLPSETAAFAGIAPSSMGRASAFYSAQIQIGSALGVALLSGVLNAVGPVSLNVSGMAQSNLAAYHAAFIAAALIVLVAASIALTIPDRDAFVTMKRKKSADESEEVMKSQDVYANS